MTDYPWWAYLLGAALGAVSVFLGLLLSRMWRRWRRFY